MAITDIYSKRASRAEGLLSDVYSYDNAPSELRHQIVHILTDLVGNIEYRNVGARVIFEYIDATLSREFGVPSLTQYDTGKSAVTEFVVHTKQVDRLLDVVEFGVRTCRRLADNDPSTESKIDELVDEFNLRCRESSFGYQIEHDAILRIDSTYTHSEIIKPALNLLADAQFLGPNQEFLSAHEHYRHDRFKECIVDCLKAFESTMKTIANIRGWTIPTKATAKDLIDACFENNLIDSMLRSHFTGLRSTLEAGVPTLRNKVAGHGQGAVPIAVPGYLAQYVLNLTGTNISMLAQAHTQTK